MRHLPLAFLTAALLAPAASAKDDVLEQLMADSSHAKVVRDGIKTLEEYFKNDLEAATESGSRGTRALKKKNDARAEFFEWLTASQDTLGIDLRAKPQTVIAMMAVARIKSLNTKVRKGLIEYEKVDDARGVDRLEYTYLLPRSYNTKGAMYPVILSLHGRVIDSKHPAFRSKDFAERSRQVVYNHWAKTPVADQAIVVAPTGNPNGFDFKKDPFRDVQAIYRVLAETLKHFHADWDRVFLEVQGSALRAACEHALMFAGIVVRDRVDDRGGLFLPEEELFMLENLNGVPLVYVADEGHWKSVGEPMAAALEKAYTKAGAAGNLLVIKAKRDPNTKGLTADAKQIGDFLLKHSRPRARKSFSWRFFQSSMKTPLPVDITGANFIYDIEGPEHPSRAAPLKDKAGALKFAVKGNAIEIEVTEAEGLAIHLYDGLVDMGQPIEVKVNGTVVREAGPVRRDWKFFWESVVPSRYFMLPFLARLDVEFESVPQFVPEEEKKEGEAKEGEPAPGGAGEGSGPAEKDATVGSGK